MVKRLCPVCGHHDGEVLYKIEMLLPDFFGLDGDYDILSCNKCGCCYANVLNSEENYDDYYHNSNFYAGWKLNAASDYDIDVITHTISSLFPYDAKIIDVGFGNGNLLCKLKGNGYTNLMGIDPSEAAVKKINSLGICGKVGSIYDDGKDVVQKADCVIFTMVLEHLLNPEKAIIAVRDNLLKDDGCLLVSWPYFEDLIADNSPMISNFNHEHITYLSRKTADYLFGKVGFFNCVHHISLAVCKGNACLFSNVAVYKRGYSYAKLCKDDNLSKSITEYINRVSKAEHDLCTSINKVAQMGTKVCIYGIGAYLFHLMKVSNLSDCNIAFLVDSNPSKQGKTFFGYKVFSPSILQDFEGVVVITVMLYGEEIKENIEKMGNNNLEIIGTV